jgi:hypothetical protein
LYKVDYRVQNFLPGDWRWSVPGGHIYGDLSEAMRHASRQLECGVRMVRIIRNEKKEIARWGWRQDRGRWVWVEEFSEVNETRQVTPPGELAILLPNLDWNWCG